MKIQMHSTTKIVELNGVPARIWKGVTEGGVECHVYFVRDEYGDTPKNVVCQALETINKLI